MKNNSLALATAIALCIHGIGAGLVSPLAGAASVPDHNPAALGALPAWFAAIPDEAYPAGAAAIPAHNPAAPGALPAWFAAIPAEAHPAADREPTADDGGGYRFEGPSWTTHLASLRPADAEPTPVPWSGPGTARTSDRLSAGVGLAAAAGGEGGTTYEYFVPFNDENLWELFDGKNTGLSPPCHPEDEADDVNDILISSVFVIASSDRTHVYYDHWEDGYDDPPTGPRSSTTKEIVLDAGAHWVFRSNINRNQVADQSVFFYDGRDRITVVGEQATVVRQVYPEEPGTVLAAAWEMPEVDDWGTAYVATVGEDLARRRQDDHRFAGLEVMAAKPDTKVYYNGGLVATLHAVTQTYFISGANDGPGGGGVDSSDIITATGPIQVQMMTGSCGTQYSAHGYTLQPVGAWDSSYWAPVPGFDPECNENPRYRLPNQRPPPDADTDVYLHNPHTGTITVTVTIGAGRYPIRIPPKATTSTLSVLGVLGTGLVDISTENHGAHFYSPEGKPFWGVAVIDSATNWSPAEPNKGRNFDWGYSLVAASRLSSHLVVGYAPGNGADPPYDNGNVAFVTAITDTVLYVDLHQDGLPDPFDMNGNGIRDGSVEPMSALGVPLAAGQVLRVGDPDDHDLAGAQIYTQDLNEKIAAAWGQDPCWAHYQDPYLDLGYTLLPTWIPRLTKTDDLAIDADHSGGVTPGDTLAYTILVHNNGTGIMHKVVLTDRLPYDRADFLADSVGVTKPPDTYTDTYYNGTYWVEDPIPDAQILRIEWPSFGPDQMVTVTFRVQLHTDISTDIVEIRNDAEVDSSDTKPITSSVETPLGRPLLSIKKDVSPTTTVPGGRVTYTVLVTNGGEGLACDTAITDVLPSWLEYVDHTLDLTWPITQAKPTTRDVTHTSSFHGTYADDFDQTPTQTTYYAGDDGSLDWSGPWTEVNDDGDPGSGEVQVVSLDGNALSAPAYLWMEDADGDDAGVERTMDLSEFVTPTLRYYVSGNTDDGNDFYRVDINGISELEIQYNGTYTIQEIDLPTVAGDPAVTLGLLASGGLEDGEYYRFDHISISESDPYRVVTRTETTESTDLTYVTRTGGDPALYDPLIGNMVITEGMCLPAGGSITATFQAQVAIPLTDGLTLTNTACTTASNWLKILSEPCADAPVRVQADHGLTVTKTAALTEVNMGGLLTYTLNYLIAGDEAVEYMVVSDTTPLSTTFYAAAPTATPTATLLTRPAVGGTGPVRWQLSGLWPPGSGITETAGTLTMTVRVHTPLISGTLIHNIVTITDTTGLSDTDEVTTPVYAAPGLDLDKTAGCMMPDTPLAYSLRIKNSGAYTFTALRLTDTLPADFWYVDGSGHPVDPDVIDEPLLVWSDLVPIAGPLAPGASLTVSFQVTTPLPSGTYTNTATVLGVHPGGTLTDTASIRTMKPAVAVQKEVFQPPDAPVRIYLPLFCKEPGADVADRNLVKFTIAITNVGPTTIDVLPLLDRYEPADLSFETATPYPEEDADDGLLTWYDLTAPAPHGFGRNLPPGASFVVTAAFDIAVTGTGTEPVTITNAVTVTGATDIHGCPADPIEDDALTPVELRYFRAVAEESAVRLEWATAVEVDCVGFYIYRAPDSDFGRARAIAYVPATGSGSTYRYVDRDVTPGRVYWYWLAEVGTDGSETTHGPVRAGVGLDASPVHLNLPPVRKDWRGHAVRAPR